MPKTLRKRKKPILSLLCSAIILATLPIAIYSLITSPSFDLRQYASEESSHCTISIPYINTKTLVLDNKYQILVYANFENEEIEYVNIVDSKSDELFSKHYIEDVKTSKISETFFFIPKQLGEDNIYGEIKTNKSSYSCKMDTNQDVIFVNRTNAPPTFLTDPYFSASPPSNSITTEQTYEYVLEVADRDKDDIHFHYSFTPKANWLNKKIVENGKDGSLKIIFSGTPDKKGSYLANIFVHDGHNENLSAQAWIINVDEEGSKIPIRPEPKLPYFDHDASNQIILEEPQITKVLPAENSYSSNPKQVISANLIASDKGTIDKDSIIFKLNDENLKTDIELIEISQREILLRYTPEKDLESGEYKAYISFKDSNEQEISKEWMFTIELYPGERMFLGMPMNTAMIFVIGLLLVLFALSIPWILYIAWKKDETKDYDEIPILKPEGDSSFKENFTQKERES